MLMDKEWVRYFLAFVPVTKQTATSNIIIIDSSTNVAYKQYSIYQRMIYSTQKPVLDSTLVGISSA